MSFQPMSKKNFDIYIDLSSNKLSIGAFQKLADHSTFFKEYNCLTNLNNSVFFRFANFMEIFSGNFNACFRRFCS